MSHDVCDFALRCSLPPVIAVVAYEIEWGDLSSLPEIVRVLPLLWWSLAYIAVGWNGFPLAETIIGAELGLVFGQLLKYFVLSVEPVD
ncbi:hypothetical protein Nepgr_007890 [Nepenthes gracilis]|uniref:Uncharacterized protein n=1 Tax=Nepenthes gracilis TaxID=150966 RepID=A0AAD3S7U1_NEPGR|nr:hypothetical protein Nepgr_007890 [Nepenthes gracilis]